MKKAHTIPGIVFLAVSFCIFLNPSAAGLPSRPQGQEAPPQEVQRPKYDYMSTFLSRSTRPLGLRDDPATRKMLGQGPVSWALRAGQRNILD